MAEQHNIESPKINDVLKLLDEAISSTLVFFEELSPSDLPKMLKAFLQLKMIKEKMEFQLEIIAKLYTQYDYEVIPNAFETLGFDSIKTAGRNFILSTRTNASIPEQSRADAHKWLIEEAKIPELIVERVNPKQLSSFVKSYFETNGKYPPEDLIKVHMQNYIQVRRA